jgi:hypothetical protein
MGNPFGLLFLLITVVGIAGLSLVTFPGIDYMLGAALDEDSEASVVGVIAWIAILWISTGVFAAMTIGGIGLTVMFLLD